MWLRKIIYHNYFMYLLILWLILVPKEILEKVINIIFDAVYYSDYKLYREDRYYIYKK